jgi:DNA-binding NtrC family response regulator
MKHAMKNLSGKCILVIDDEPAMLRALSRVLSGEGATAICASWVGDGMDVLTKRDRQVDLVITDLRMPFVTGMTVLYAIQEIFPKLPVIVLTAFGSPEVRAACREEGAFAFLEKPLDSEELLQVVREALGLEAPKKRKEGAGADGPAGSAHTSRSRARAHSTSAESASAKEHNTM